MGIARLVISLLCLSIIGCVGQITDVDPSDPEMPSQGSGSGSNTTPAPLTVMEYLTQLGNKECTAAFTCRATYPADAPMSFETLYGTSQSACGTTIVASYEPASIETEVVAGNVYFNAAEAKTCLAGLTAGDCATFWSNGGISLSSCRDVFKGTASDGDTCVIDLDCVNWDSICDAATSTCVATDAGD
jgi:hypothetical protein